MRHVLNRSGLVVQVAVLGLFVTTVGTFGWAIARTVQLIGNLLDGGFADDQLLIDLLETIDTYLIAVVQLIFVIGLYELFIGDLDVPDWLEVHSLDDLRNQLREFARVRDWEQFHSPKNLAMAMIVEAAELTEHFQWLTEAQSQALDPEKREQVAQELADVFLYLVRLADRLDIDLMDAAQRKLVINAHKYPADKVRGSAKKAGDS